MALIQMEIDGTTIWVDEANASATARRGPTSDTVYTSARSGSTSTGVDAGVEKLTTKLAMVNTLKVLLGPVREVLDTLGPEEVTVELSLGLKGEVGVFVAKSEGEASLKITATWKAEPKKPI